MSRGILHQSKTRIHPQRFWGCAHVAHLSQKKYTLILALIMRSYQLQSRSFLFLSSHSFLYFFARSIVWVVSYLHTFLASYELLLHSCRTALWRLLPSCCRSYVYRFHFRWWSDWANCCWLLMSSSCGALLASCAFRHPRCLRKNVLPLSSPRLHLLGIQVSHSHQVSC